MEVRQRGRKAGPQILLRPPRLSSRLVSPALSESSASSGCLPAFVGHSGMSCSPWLTRSAFSKSGGLVPSRDSKTYIAADARGAAMFLHASASEWLSGRAFDSGGGHFREQNSTRLSSRYDPLSAAIHCDLPMAPRAGRDQPDDLASPVRLQ